MTKTLLAFATMALVVPASRAWAESDIGADRSAAVAPAARAQDGWDDASVAERADLAGGMETKAGEQAMKAGARAEAAGAEAREAERSPRAAGGSRARRDEPEVRRALHTIAHLEEVDPGLRKLFGGAAGYAVFPSVSKLAVGVGGAHGSGVLFERGRATGDASLTQVTVGLQIGGEEYTEVIFFQDQKALSSFKEGKLAMAAQASAVAISAGASADARYIEGVSVFTLPRNGLMAEASIGGQKFGYRPFAPMVTASVAPARRAAKRIDEPERYEDQQESSGGGR
jgi:lipid-binding SYLF domain-containing protein